MRKLTPIQEDVLLAVGLATNFSPNGRRSFKKIYVKTSVEVKKLKDSIKVVKKSLKELVAMGYITKKPSGQMTYSLSSIGREYVLSL